ncbi:MAG: hypothetical protein ABFR53_02240 [Actinomycetota bacterium]
MGRWETSRVVLVAIGALVAVLVAVAVVIALQPPEVLDPATPEGTAQGYFQALHDRDGDLITTYLTDDLADRCDSSRYLEEFWRFDDRIASGVSIVSTDIDGDEARMRVTITVTYGDGPFNAGSETIDETLVMQRHGDVWLISEPPWPWDGFVCERESEREGEG